MGLGQDSHDADGHPGAEVQSVSGLQNPDYSPEEGGGRSMDERERQVGDTRLLQYPQCWEARQSASGHLIRRQICISSTRRTLSWLVDYYRNAWPFDMVVVDESSNFKVTAQKRFKALASVRWPHRPAGGLTGTPSQNGLADYMAQVFLLDGRDRLGRRYAQFRAVLPAGQARADGMVYSYEAKPGDGEASWKRYRIFASA